MDKPKRWTWEEFIKKIPDRDLSFQDIMNWMNTGFHANEPYIEHLEKENERLAITRDEKLGSVYESYDYETLAEQLVVEETLIKDLEARIAELEQWNRNHVQTAGWQQTQIVVQQKTITTLREALEEIGEDYTVDNTWLVDKARTALKECFGGKDEG